jgi:hypothetical protein
MSSLILPSSNVNPNEIFQQAHVLVEEHIGIVDDAVGRDIVVFLGGSQAGKSVTINCCCGVPFSWRMPDPEPGRRYAHRHELVPDSRSPPVAPIGTGRRSKTQLLAVYPGPNGLFFVDTRGVGEVDAAANPGWILASGILTEVICRVARSVRIVIVARSASCKPLSHLAPVLDQIGSLLISSTASMLWIFNDHNPPVDVRTREEFMNVHDSIGSLIEDLIGDFKPPSQREYEAARGAGSAGTDQQPLPNAPKPPSEVLQEVIASLGFALENKSFTYIDPASPFSVELVCNQIQDLPAASVNDLRLEATSLYRQAFYDGLLSLLLPERNLLDLYRTFVVVDPDSIAKIDASAVVECLVKNSILLSDAIRRRFDDAERRKQRNCLYFGNSGGELV